MDDKFLWQFMMLVLTVGWSLLFYLGKRTLRGIDRKLDASFEHVQKTAETLQVEMGKREKKIETDIRRLGLRTAKELGDVRGRLTAGGLLGRRQMSRIAAGFVNAHARIFVSRQEFGAFAANMNHKVEAIYMILRNEGTKRK